MIDFLFPFLLANAWLWPILLLASSAYLLFIWLLFFFSLLDYFLDIWVITNMRVIDVRQDGFFSRSTSEIRVEWIQDISSDSEGFFATVFRYGNVTVQTAGQHNSLLFEQVPNPENIRDLLMQMVNKKEVSDKKSS